MVPKALVVGHVAELWRYPVKSMAGEQLRAADVSWHGVAGDRRWAFIRPGLTKSDFPWLTIRERSEMGQYRPSFADPDRPDDSRTVVTTPDGRELDVTDPELAAELGAGVQVIKQNRGIFDAAPLALITTRTIASLSATVGRDLEVQRFRPNIVVEPAEDESFPEDPWVGAVLRAGSFAMRVDRRDERCVVVNVDPDTNERDHSILRTIAHAREACLGVYGTTVEPGRVAVGDAIVVDISC
jgi:uncharacterized protein YcbX